MGFEYSTYFGAYLEVKDKTAIFEHPVCICSICNINYSMDNRTHDFCPKCGNKIPAATMETEEPESFRYFYYDNFEDGALYSPEYPNKDGVSYMFPNRSDSLARLEMPDIESCEILEIKDTITPEKYITAFKEQYQDIIAALETEGFEYEIKFGFVNTAS